MGSMKYLAEELEQIEDLDQVTKAVAREQVIRDVMAETGESRQIVAETLDAAQAMDEEAVLGLTEGQPTTLVGALSRYIEDLEQRPGPVQELSVAADLTALLNHPWPAERPSTWPDAEDSLERHEWEPASYHLRETINYPLMGSSPAERAEARERGDRIRHQAMRDHVFVEGDGPNCAAMLPAGISGSPETGVVTMTIGCGYPRDTHPDSV